MPDVAPMHRRLRWSWTGGLVLLVKLAIAAAAMAWLYSRDLLDLAVLDDVSHSSATYLLLLAGAASMALAVFLLALRLRMLLLFARFDVGVAPATLITFVGFFFGALLPGSVGADAIRVTYFCGRVAERRMDVVTAILFDRVIGLFALLLLASLALAVAWLADVWRDGFAILITAPTLLGLTAIAALLFARSSGRVLPAALRKRVPWRLATFLEGSRSLLRNGRLLAATLAISLVSHALMVVSFVVIAVVITDSLAVVLHFVISPLAVTLNSVPISPGGLGITEGAFAYLFMLSGSDNGALIGLLGRLLQYSVYAVGGSVSLLFLRWRGDPFTSLRSDDSAPRAGSDSFRPSVLRGN